jgi:hypothetical protein
MSYYQLLAADAIYNVSIQLQVYINSVTDFTKVYKLMEKNISIM